jgi:hypothetical protein
MNAMKFAVPLFVALAYSPAQGLAGPLLGTSEAFAVLAGASTTNTGSTTITGNYGVSPGTPLDMTGITLTGAPHATDAVAAQAQVDLTTAYLGLKGLPSTTNLTGQNLAGLTLTSGVYKFNSSAFLTGTSAIPGVLTLNAQGLDDQLFVFQIGSTLITSAADTGTITSAKVQIINPGANDAVYWVVGSAATIKTYTQFEGNILSLAQIALQTGATIECGRALNQTPGPVTMDTNTISIGCTGVTGEANGLSGTNLAFDTSGNVVNTETGKIVAGAAAAPEPGTLALFGFGLAGLTGLARRRQPPALRRITSSA